MKKDSFDMEVVVWIVALIVIIFLLVFCSGDVVVNEIHKDDEWKDDYIEWLQDRLYKYEGDVSYEI